MKTAAVVSCLAALANAAAVNIDRREAPLDIKIDQVGNSEVKASISNTGSAPLRVVKTGSILDSVPVAKTKITQGADEIPFMGVRLYINYADLEDDAFQTIDAGETVEVQWDAAQFHDLSGGGDFDIAAYGSLHFAEEGSNKIAGQIVYSSNVVQAKVDGVQAAQVHAAHSEALAKRVTVQSDCTGSQRDAVNSAITAARGYAQQAASAANAGTRLQEYFKSTSASTRSTVVDVFNKVANNVYNTNNSGATRLYCTDVGSFCGNGVVAYTQPGANEYMVYCPYWFQFPATGNECHIADRPYVLVHESTHLVIVKATNDVCYGYQGCVTTISSSQSLNNADSYALYSNAIRLNCQ